MRDKPAYADVLLFVDGRWRTGSGGLTLPIVDPSTERELATVAVAGDDDIDAAAAAAHEAFPRWARSSALERAAVMKRAAGLLRERRDPVAARLSLEQGKPLGDARGEVERGGDTIEWFAEEARRVYGRIVPPRVPGVRQSVEKVPVGVVAAFTPWNFPINQAVRKLGPALAAGCTLVLKGSEETPGSVADLVQVFHDAGLPRGVLNLLYGQPARISERLIRNPLVRKISFTGSTAVGKQLASLAGQHMKRVTMELGGHAPAIVFADADLERAVDVLVTNKFRNAGQICTSPTRFFVQRQVVEAFTAMIVEASARLRVGDPFAAGSQMGPLANRRRLEAVARMVDDAIEKGAVVRCGGGRIGDTGYYFAPTVLSEVRHDARVMHEEPFGPLIPILAFDTYEEAVARANDVPYGLAAYAHTGSERTADALSADLDAGMVAINGHGIGLIELPFGGVKESGYGSEGGPEAMLSYLVDKVVVRQT